MTTLATCWKITREDTTVLAFTDHDEDLVVDAVTYYASIGYSPSAIEHDTAGASYNMEVTGIINFSGLDENDLRAGLFDYAQIECFQINWETLSDKVNLVKGWLGKVSTADGQFNAELKGMSQKLHNNTGEQYMPTCAADLGDSRCGITPGSASFTVTSGGNNRIFTDSGLGQADDYFKGGKVVVSTGDNAGFTMDVKEFSAGVVELYEPLPNTFSIGDTGTIYQGCDKILETCRDTFDNVINFRGFPHLPGMGELLR